MTHANSLAAHRTNRYGERCRDILRELETHGPGTAREIKERLGLADMNAVRPRLTDLGCGRDGLGPGSGPEGARGSTKGGKGEEVGK